jgi:hypothetical protein
MFKRFLAAMQQSLAGRGVNPLFTAFARDFAGLEHGKGAWRCTA